MSRRNSRTLTDKDQEENRELKTITALAIDRFRQDRSRPLFARFQNVAYVRGYLHRDGRLFDHNRPRVRPYFSRDDNSARAIEEENRKMLDSCEAKKHNVHLAQMMQAANR